MDVYFHRTPPAQLAVWSPIVRALLASRPRITKGAHRTPMARLVAAAGMSSSAVSAQFWVECVCTACPQATHQKCMHRTPMARLVAVAGMSSSAVCAQFWVKCVSTARLQASHQKGHAQDAHGAAGSSGRHVILSGECAVLGQVCVHCSPPGHASWSALHAQCDKKIKKSYQSINNQ